MKHQFKKGLWAFAALAVLAAPLTLDQVIGKTSFGYRSIASEDPIVTTAPSEPVCTGEAACQEEVIKKLNEELSAEKKKAEELQAQLTQSQAEVVASREVDATKTAKIAELEKSVSDQVARIAELEAKVKELEGQAEVSKQELDQTKLALEEAKKASEEAQKALEEANKKVAEVQEALRLKEEDLKKKEEELAAKTEEARLQAEQLAKKEEEAKKREEELALRAAELAQSKKDHDLFVCQAEERDSALTKQIEELNKQQQQFTQVMLGLNQVLIGLFQQMNQQPQQQGMQVLGMGQNYFGMQQPAYGMGQMPSPTQNVVMGSYMFNPWQQQQPSVVNNYYGYGMGQQPMMGQPQMGMGQGMGGFQMPTPYYQQQTQPGFFGFDQGFQGMQVPAMNDAGRAVFGGLQPQMGAQMPQVMM